MTNYYILCFELFAVIAFIIAIDKNVGRYIYLSSRLFLIQLKIKAIMIKLWIQLKYDRYTLLKSIDKSKKA